MYRLWQVLPTVTTLITDVDGVLTDGGLRYGETGEVMKVFQARDGAALKEARQAGLRIVVISGRKHPALVQRLDDLGSTDRQPRLVTRSLLPSTLGWIYRRLRQLATICQICPCCRPVPRRSRLPMHPPY